MKRAVIEPRKQMGKASEADSMLCSDKSISATGLLEMVVLLSRNVTKIYRENVTMYVVLVGEGKEMWPVRDI